MLDRTDRILRICASLFLLLAPKASPAAADQVLKVPFEYANNRNSILVHVKIDEQPAVLIVDTGSAHTVLRPELLHIKPSELMPTRPGSSGGGFIGDAIGKEVTLQVGNWKWLKRRVAVMDLSQVFAVYQQQIDGVLGLDFFQEFATVTINVKEKTILFVR
jgi:aspartyl protease